MYRNFYIQYRYIKKGCQRSITSNSLSDWSQDCTWYQPRAGPELHLSHVWKCVALQAVLEGTRDIETCILWLQIHTEKGCSNKWLLPKRSVTSSVLPLPASLLLPQSFASVLSLLTCISFDSCWNFCDVI